MLAGADAKKDLMKSTGRTGPTDAGRPHVPATVGLAVTAEGGGAAANEGSGFREMLIRVENKVESPAWQPSPPEFRPRSG